MRNPERSVLLSRAGFYGPPLSAKSGLQEFKSRTQKQEFSVLSPLLLVSHVQPGGFPQRALLDRAGG